MAIRLGTNISSLQAQRRLGEATSATGRIFEQLSSGLRINRASDDAAGLAIADDLNSKTRVYTQAILNGNDAQSVLSIADSTLQNLTSVVTRIRELAQQSANGTFSNQQRKSLDAEAQALAREYFRVSRSASFNGINLFDGSLADGIRFQLGYGTDGSILSTVGGDLGTGAVTNTLSYATETTATNDTALGDLNGDGILDLVTAGAAGLTGSITVRLGTGSGTFGSATSYSGDLNGTGGIALGDLNGDGVLDLVTAGSYGAAGQSSVRLGNGDGTFGSAASYAMDSGASAAVQLADLNQDGNLDIVTAGGSVGGSLVYRFGTGNGTFGSLNIIATGGTVQFSDVSVGDLNNDGILDLVATNGGRTGLNYVSMGNSSGGYDTAVSYGTNTNNNYSTTLGDVNGDGILDIVGSGDNGSDGFAYVQLGTGTGAFSAGVTYAMEGDKSSDVALGDMNGDGILDLVTTGNTGTDAYSSIRLGTGNGTFESVTSVASNTFAANALSLGDINGDGVLDIVSGGQADGPSGSATVLIGNTRDGVAPLVPFSLKTKGDSLQAMGILDRALSNLSVQRGVIGSFQSRIVFAVNTLQSARESFAAAESRIRDVDVAAASAELVRTQILQKAATAVLAQANEEPQLVLKLLGV